MAHNYETQDVGLSAELSQRPGHGGVTDNVITLEPPMFLPERNMLLQDQEPGTKLHGVFRAIVHDGTGRILNFYAHGETPEENFQLASELTEAVMSHRGVNVAEVSSLINPDDKKQVVITQPKSPAPINVPFPRGFKSLDEMRAHVDWTANASAGLESLGKGLMAAAPVIASWNRARSPLKPMIAGALTMVMSGLGKEAAHRMQKDTLLYEFCADTGIVELVPNP